MKMIFELFIKQKTWFNFVSFLTEQTLGMVLRSDSRSALINMVWVASAYLHNLISY